MEPFHLGMCSVFYPCTLVLYTFAKQPDEYRQRCYFQAANFSVLKPYNKQQRNRMLKKLYGVPKCRKMHEQGTTTQSHSLRRHAQYKQDREKLFYQASVWRARSIVVMTATVAGGSTSGKPHSSSMLPTQEKRLETTTTSCTFGGFACFRG